MAEPTPCPACGRRLTLFAHVARCFTCGWRSEPNPYREAS